MGNEPSEYEKALARIMVIAAGPVAPTELPKSPESQQRMIVEQEQIARHRRQQERETEAARQRARKFEADKQKASDDQQRINSVEAWHVAEEQAKKEYVASGGFIEDFKFDREAWIKSNEERGKQRARKMSAHWAI